MSKENVEIALGQFEAINRQDYQAVLAAWGDDAILVFHGELRGAAGSGATGKQAVERWFSDWFGRFDDYRFQVDEIRDLGEGVLVVATHSGTGRGSGAPVTFQTSYVFDVGEGLIRRLEVWLSRDEALAAAGR